MDIVELLPRARPGLAGLDRRERLVRRLLRLTVRPALHPRTPPRLTRHLGEILGRVETRTLDRTGITFGQEPIADLATEVVGFDAAPGWRDDDRTLPVYLHGGGYRVGSPRTHRRITLALARELGRGVLVPDYPLAPEHPFPAARDAVIDWLSAVREQSGRDVVLLGDSAGGNLAVTVSLGLRDAGLPLPCALGLVSPWADLRPRDQGANVRRDDALLWPDPDAMAARDYTGGRENLLASGDVSPALADLTGLPPMLIQVGTEELLRDGVELLATAADEAGVEVTLERYGGMWHVHQLSAGMLPAADLALGRLASFVADTETRTRAAG